MDIDHRIEIHSCRLVGIGITVHEIATDYTKERE